MFFLSVVIRHTVFAKICLFTAVLCVIIEYLTLFLTLDVTRHDNELKKGSYSFFFPGHTQYVCINILRRIKMYVGVTEYGYSRQKTV